MTTEDRERLRERERERERDWCNVWPVLFWCRVNSSISSVRMWEPGLNYVLIINLPPTQ